MNRNSKNKAHNGKTHICEECGSSFNRPYRLVQHLLVHRNIRTFTCGEENCNKSYSSKSHLDRHIHSVHIKPTLEVINRCLECMKIFANRQNLKRHIKVRHFRKEIFVCDVCNSDFKKKHLLSAHMYCHTFVKSFSCHFCEKEFITLHEKKKHLKMHKTYNCEHCDMAFNHWSKYQKHKQIDHKRKEYKCNDCGRVFKQRHHIVRHVKIHMSQPFFKCWYKECNRLYSRNSNLKQHIRMKHMSFAHPCGICGAELSTKQKVKAHLLTHCKKDKVIRQPSIADGRKERRDKGSIKKSTALKIAGLAEDPHNNIIIEDSQSASIESNGNVYQNGLKENMAGYSEKVSVKNVSNVGTDYIENNGHVPGTETETIISSIVVSIDNIKSEDEQAEIFASVTKQKDEFHAAELTPMDLSIRDSKRNAPIAYKSRF